MDAPTVIALLSIVIAVLALALSAYALYLQRQDRQADRRESEKARAATVRLDVFQSTRHRTGIWSSGEASSPHDFGGHAEIEVVNVGQVDVAVRTVWLQPVGEDRAVENDPKSRPLTREAPVMAEIWMPHGLMTKNAKFYVGAELASGETFTNGPFLVDDQILEDCGYL